MTQYHRLKALAFQPTEIKDKLMDKKHVTNRGKIVHAIIHETIAEVLNSTRS